MAFMLPVATPPNAIVFGSGYITVPQMSRAGLVLNVCAIVVITLLGSLLVPWLLVR
jgi:sodium-dependent dicarboxylate transporter 2/3/5